jgi:hypothetical protein
MGCTPNITERMSEFDFINTTNLDKEIKGGI